MLEIREDCSEDRKPGAKPGGHGEGSSQQREQKTFHRNPVGTAMEPFPGVQGKERQLTDVRNYAQSSSASSTGLAVCIRYMHICI